MTRAPNFEIQAAVRNTLLAAPTVSALVGDRVFDGAKAGTFPYIHLDDDHIIGVNDGADFFECNVNVHVYTEEQGTALVRKLCDAVIAALDVELELQSFVCNETHIQDIIAVPEPVGRTRHRVVRMRYLVQPTD